jgi:hypothetical protein
MSATFLDQPGDLADTARLLFDVYHAPQFRDARYVDWYYRKNPLGPAIETDLVDEHGRLGHMAGIPHVYHSRRGTLRAMFPLNIAVHERGRGKGGMAQMTARCYAETEKRLGSALMLGMANQNSVAYYGSKGGYRVVLKMPVTICPSIWPDLGGVETRSIEPDYLASSEFEALFDTLDLSPGEGWSERYTLPFLRWRLSRPDSDYRIHVGDEAVVVTSSDRRHGVLFTIVMKTFRRKSANGARVGVNGVIAAACRQRRTPLAVYAGFSGETRIRGIGLPERLKPAPLYLCVSARPAGFLDLPSFVYETFEFLEFDVY